MHIQFNKEAKRNFIYNFFTFQNLIKSFKSTGIKFIKTGKQWGINWDKNYFHFSFEVNEYSDINNFMDIFISIEFF